MMTYRDCRRTCETYRTAQPCEACGGVGKQHRWHAGHWVVVKCKTCNGRGKAVCDECEYEGNE